MTAIKFLPRWSRAECILLLVSVLYAGRGAAQGPAKPVPKDGLQLSLWAREPMVMDPVALSFDDQGVLYVAETARRGTVDIDIRSHREWLVEDLANQSVDDLRQFFRRRMAPELSHENATWLRDYNEDGLHDWHDLEGVKERIRRLEDTQGTGRADRSSIFAEGFNEEISGVVAGVMPWAGDVFVTGYPELKRFRDLNGDGVADTEETVFRGFGVHAAFDGHDLHGLIVGPDGKIYFSQGDNGFSVTNREGQRLHHPNTGGVFRMNPDGSDLEVFATGLRNPQEVAFDEYGNLFAVDNDGDLRDERERFVYIAEGSDSGWRLNWQFRDPGWAEVTGQPNYNPWMDERMWVPKHPGQPAYITPPLTNYSVGPGSFKYNPGTALNEAYRRFFFLIQFPVQKVTAFQVRPQGAGFEMTDEHTVLSGMMASAVNFGPDGALYVADWDGMWNPNGTGAIWTLDDPRAKGSPARRGVQRLLREGMRERAVSELMLLLGHADQRIRLRAQFELVRRQAAGEFLTVVGVTAAPQLARVHALWGLGQLRPQLAPEQLPFRDDDFQIRAQAAKLAGDLQLRAAAPMLVGLLNDTNSRVQFQAALALGKAGDASAIPALVNLLAANHDADPFLRHAAVMGLAGIGDPIALERLAAHASPSVRIGAVVALRRLRSPSLAVFLKDPDPLVRREAARAIHDDESVPDALPALAALLGEPSVDKDEALARRVISANLRLGTGESAQRLLAYTKPAEPPEPLRLEALEALAAWDRSPALDRVEGRVRPLGPRSLELGRQLIAGQLDTWWPQAGKEMTETLSRIVLEQHLPAKPAIFAEWVASTNQSTGVRTAALAILAQSDSELLPAALRAAGQAPEPALRQAAMQVLARRSAPEFFTYLQTRADRQTLREQQLGVRLAGTLAEPPATEFLSHQLDQLTAGKLPPELMLDVLEATRTNPAPALRSRAEAYEREATAAGATRRYEPLLHGGDPEAGRVVFRTSIQGQCGRCHDAGGEGQQAGPTLAGIGGRVTPEYLLEALLDPSARIADGFATVSLTLKDGDVLDGLKLQETDKEVKLRLATGETRSVPVSAIAQRSASSQSVMPPMTDVLTPRELRDVVAFLAGWKNSRSP